MFSVTEQNKIVQLTELRTLLNEVKSGAFGAARLARLATTGEAPEEVCTAPSVLETVEPEPQLAELYSPRVKSFRSLYHALKPEFARS